MNEIARQTADRVIATRKHMAGALMPILQGIRGAVGYIPAQAVESITQAQHFGRAAQACPIKWFRSSLSPH